MESLWDQATAEQRVIFLTESDSAGNTAAMELYPSFIKSKKKLQKG